MGGTGAVATVGALSMGTGCLWGLIGAGWDSTVPPGGLRIAAATAAGRALTFESLKFGGAMTDPSPDT